MVKLDPNINIAELTEKYPEVIEYLITEYQFHCIGCFISDYENLQEGARVHGIVDDDFDQLIVELENLINQNQSAVSPSAAVIQPKAQRYKLLMISMNGVYVKGIGIKDNTLMFAAITRKQGVTPSEYLDAYNKLLPSYLTDEINQSNFWEMLNESAKVKIDSTVDWFGKYYVPQRDPQLHNYIEKLRLNDQRVVAVLDTVESQAAKLEKRGDFDVFDEVYRSDNMGTTKSNIEFYQVILAHEGVEPSEVLLVDNDKSSLEIASQLGINTLKAKNDVVAQLEEVIQ